MSGIVKRKREDEIEDDSNQQRPHVSPDACIDGHHTGVPHVMQPTERQPIYAARVAQRHCLDEAPPYGQASVALQHGQSAEQQSGPQSLPASTVPPITKSNSELTYNPAGTGSGSNDFVGQPHGSNASRAIHPPQSMGADDRPQVKTPPPPASHRPQPTLTASKTTLMPPAKAQRLVSSLDEVTVRHLLATTFPRSAESFDIVTQAHKHARKVIAFDRHPRDIEHDLDERHEDAEGREDIEVEYAVDAIDEIKTRVGYITEAARRPKSEQTRYNALKTLCDIGRVVVQADNTCVGSEVVRLSGEQHYLEDAMLDILQSTPSMGQNKWEFIRSRVLPPYEASANGFLDKLVSLKSEGDRNECFVKLYEVLEMLGGYV